MARVVEKLDEYVVDVGDARAEYLFPLEMDGEGATGRSGKNSLQWSMSASQSLRCRAVSVTSAL